LPADRWAIVTSAPRALAMRRLQATGLPLPQWVITSEDVDHGKPAPDCFLLAAKRLGVPIGDCLVFEDAPAGVAAAEAAGASVVVVTATHTQPLATPHRTVKGYDGLVVAPEARGWASGTISSRPGGSHRGDPDLTFDGKREVRYGLVGTGSIADHAHAPALDAATNSCLCSVLGRSCDRAEKFARKHHARGPKPATCSLGEFLDDEALDAVIITVPDRLHFEYAKAALEAGKHVLIEKPMVTTAVDAQALVDLARRQGLILGVGYHLRFHPGFRLVRQMIVDGHIGELRHILAQWTFYRPTDDEWRAKSALGEWWSLAATGSHCRDLCHWLTSATGRSRVDLKAIVTNNVFSGPNDESAAVIASYTGGCTAMITSSVLFDAPTIFNVYGEKGCIEAKGMLARRSTTPFLLNGEAREYPSEDPYQKQVVAFSQAIVHGGAFESDGVVGSHGVNDLLSIVQ
jgi:predicted dehydrogenase